MRICSLFFVYVSFCIGIIFTSHVVYAQQQFSSIRPTSYDLVEQLLRTEPDKFGAILKEPNKYRVQILYTQIERGWNNKPRFRPFFYRANSREYFYPASTVKFPTAVVALEKLNKLNRVGIRGLDKFTSLRIDSSWAGQRPVTRDPSAKDSLPSIAHYIKKILLVSDNDAHNRLFEFIGADNLNRALHNKGYKDVKITRRLSIGSTPEEDRHTNPFTFYRRTTNDTSEQILYRQAGQFASDNYKFTLSGLQQGKGYKKGDSLITKPFDFTPMNYISLEVLQNVLKAVIFPEAVEESKRFQLTEQDYDFLYSYMSMMPRESDYPKYDTTEQYDSYCKFFMFGDNKKPMPKHIRIFNKVGDAYGYIIDNAYIVDFEKKVEFLLTAVIYANDDGIFNDDKYEYDTVSFPFMANLGKLIYNYELARERRRAPDLRKFEKYQRK